MARSAPERCHVGSRCRDFTATFLRLIDLDEVRVWRMSRRARVLSVAMIMAMAASSGYAAFWAARHRDPVSYALLAVVAIIDIVIARTALYTFRSVTVAGPDGVRIGRGRRAVTVPWHAIESCVAGARGTVIDCSDGRRVLAAAPQQADVKRGQHSKTEADYAALYLTERARMFRVANATQSPGR